MKKIIVLFMVARFLCFAASAGAAGNDRIMTVNLKNSKQNAGALGRATFVAMGESGEVQFYIAGPLPFSMARPVHICTYIYPGSCAKLGKKPAYEMNDTTIMNRAGGDTWKVTKKLPVALSSLLAGSYAVVVRSTPADGNLNLFCGDIR
jgi:hypothetical protein